MNPPDISGRDGEGVGTEKTATDVTSNDLATLRSRHHFLRKITYVRSNQIITLAFGESHGDLRILSS